MSLILLSVFLSINYTLNTSQLKQDFVQSYFTVKDVHLYCDFWFSSCINLVRFWCSGLNLVSWKRLAWTSTSIHIGKLLLDHINLHLTKNRVISIC